MIHGGSNDPVLIKKIQLKLWTLRSEVENTIKLITEKKNRSLTKEEIELIKEEYSFKKPVSEENNLLLLNGGKEENNEESSEGDDLEAEMAAALEEGNSGEEEAAEEGEEDLEAEMAAALEEGKKEDENSENNETTAEEIGKAVQVIQRTSNGLPEECVAKGVTILSEVGIDSIAFFTSRPYLMGQSIVLEFRIPKRFVINADIVMCRPINIKSRIISPEKLSYRAIAKFTFLKQGERTLLRNLLKSIEPEVPVAPVKKAKAKEDDDDDFDDLDSLDF